LDWLLTGFAQWLCLLDYMDYVDTVVGREVLLWLLGRRRRLRVVGGSMLPMLSPETEVLVDLRAYRQGRSPSVGEIVVAEHPHQSGFWLIKRVAAIRDNGDCVLLGDNLADSTDSRSFGAIAPTKLLGLVTCRFF
jgi:nickel-type superoxide dismutase maturation protease